VPSSFHIENFGCRAARADGEAIASLLRAAGLVDGLPANADVVVVNTCSVTAEADREARAFIRRAHRLNPEARILATGCYAQRAPRELAELPGVSAVVGNSHKALAPQVAYHLANPPVASTRASSLVQTAFDLVQKHDFDLDKCELIPVSGRDFSHADSTPQLNRAAPEGSSPTVSIQSLLTASRPGQTLVLTDDTFAHSFLEEAPIIPGVQTRPNLKIQEGCGNRCSFCVIPQTRGSSRSLPAASVLRHVENFVAAGGNELVLSGINLGRWGRDLVKKIEPAPMKDMPAHPKGTGFTPYMNEFDPSHLSGARFSPYISETDSRHLKGTGFSPYINPPNRKGVLTPVAATALTLAALVRRIFAQTTLPRLRLSSIEPMDWDADLIALMSEFGGSRLARHAHLPLQSGSDAVLRRMHRRYRPWHYAEKVAALFHAAGPSLTLGADVMVGFPGETDREFEETLEFVRNLPFAYLHLFPFSPRPGTRAWSLHADLPVPIAAVAERMAALRALAAEKSHAHRARFLTRELDAITLRTPPALAESGRTVALTENFLPMELAASLSANRLVRVRVTGLSPDDTLLADLAPIYPGISTAISHFRPEKSPTQPILQTVS
jgi:tRNA A37 methylthiotransferase MiaB